jgi:hypothetical protein
VLTLLPATARWLAQTPAGRINPPPTLAPVANLTSYAGRPVPNPGPGTPSGAQPWAPGALPPYPAQPTSPPNGPVPYSADPTPCTAAPPVAGTSDDSPWRRPEL